MIVQCLVCVAYFRIPPRIALLVVYFVRSQEVTKDAKFMFECMLKKGPSYLSWTWPRWLLFIIGTLPAAVKLASLSGVPWAQTWGILFAASFLAIELFSALPYTLFRKSWLNILLPGRTTNLLSPIPLVRMRSPFSSSLVASFSSSPN
jgi:hypothetical protein